MDRVHIITLGCPKNTVDSEQMHRRLELNGYVVSENPESADVIVVPADKSIWITATLGAGSLPEELNRSGKIEPLEFQVMEGGAELVAAASPGIRWVN